MEPCVSWAPGAPVGLVGGRLYVWASNLADCNWTSMPRSSRFTTKALVIHRNNLLVIKKTNLPSKQFAHEAGKIGHTPLNVSFRNIICANKLCKRFLCLNTTLQTWTACTSVMDTICCCRRPILYLPSTARYQRVWISCLIYVDFQLLFHDRLYYVHWENCYGSGN